MALLKGAGVSDQRTPSPWGSGERSPQGRRAARPVLGFGAVGFIAVAVWLQSTPDLLEDLPRHYLWVFSLLGALGQGVGAIFLGSTVTRTSGRPRPMWRKGPANNLLQAAKHFVGYTAEQQRMRRLLARFPRRGWRGLLDKLSRGTSPDALSAPLVIVVTGLPATGKSQLANRIAREVSDRFPDGVRWVDLCHNTNADDGDGAEDAEARQGTGKLTRWLPSLPLPRLVRRRFSPGDPGPVGMDGPRLGPIVPRTVQDLLEELLGAADDTPRGPRRQLEDAWRTLTTGRRILLVLENAEDPRQVEALRPNSPWSAVLVTSRRSFHDATFDFESVEISGLTVDEGIELLERIAPIDDAGRQGDQERVLRREIAELCHGLPLALGMCGSRLAWSSGPDAQQLLETLRREDESPLLATKGFPASFTVVFQMCGAMARLLLRRMAATGMDEIADFSAAALLEVPCARAREVIEELQALFLIEPLGHADDGVYRYRLHELVRDTLRVLHPDDFGIPLDEERAWRPEAVRAARERLLRVYTWMAEQAAENMRRTDDGFPQPDLAASERVRDTAQALDLQAAEHPRAWLDREREMLLGCIWMAASDGHAGLGWRLARAVAAMCQTVRTHWAEWDQAVQAQLALAHGERDPHALGMALLDASELSGSRGGYGPGATYARRAAYVFGELGTDQRWTARARRARGVNLHRWGALDAALEELSAAARVFEEKGEAWWHARTLYNLAELHADLGRHDHAKGLLQRACAAFDAEGDVDQRDLTRILLAEVLASRGRELNAWYMLEELRGRFIREDKRWYTAQCLRVMGGLDDAALGRQYATCDLVFNRMRRAELRDEVERHHVQELRDRERGNDVPATLQEHMELRQRYRERLQQDAAALLGEYADGAETTFTRAAAGGWRRSRERKRAWSYQTRTAMLREAIGVMERMGDAWGMRRAQLTLGQVLVRAHDIDEGRRLLDRAADGFARLASTGQQDGELGDKRWQARAHHIAAQTLFDTEGSHSAEHESETMVPQQYRPHAVVASRARKLEAALEHARRARDVYLERENHTGRISAEILIARILWSGRAESEEVSAHLDTAETEAKQRGYPELAREAEMWQSKFFEEYPEVVHIWPIN